jgi:hypothetical protein
MATIRAFGHYLKNANLFAEILKVILYHHDTI